MPAVAAPRNEKAARKKAARPGLKLRVAPLNTPGTQAEKEKAFQTVDLEGLVPMVNW